MEDYLKNIYKLQSGSGAVTTTALADRMQVSTASATNMVKRLAEMGLVEHIPYKGFRLSRSGRLAALEVIRHHRLLELFLYEHLGVDLEEVHTEAEVLEHVLSERLEALIDRALGHPDTDPHGDPIPNREGEIREVAYPSLASLKEGEAATVRRVRDRDAGELRELAEKGLVPGTRFQVIRNDEQYLHLDVRGRRVRVSNRTAHGVHVAPEERQNS